MFAADGMSGSSSLLHSSAGRDRSDDAVVDDVQSDETVSESIDIIAGAAFGQLCEGVGSRPHRGVSRA